MDKPCYRVRDWDRIYENAQSRRHKTLSWIPMPNKHDSGGFGELATRPKAVAEYCGWVLLLQEASKMPVRGLLMTENGPLTPRKLARRTRFPQSCFEAAIEMALDPDINWLEIVPDTHARSALGACSECSRSTSAPKERTEPNGTERNGKERNRTESGSVDAQDRTIGSDRTDGRKLQAFQQTFAVRILEALGINSTEGQRQAKSMFANARRIARHPDRTRITDELADLARAKVDAGLVRPVAAWQAEFNKRYPKTMEQ